MRNLLVLILALSFSLILDCRSFAAAPAQKDWTFLVYLNGNNSLDSFAPGNMKEMEKLGSNANVNVVVQWASLQQNNTQRIYVEKSTDPSKVTSPAVQTLANVDMGDYRSLVEFVRWGVANYPAKHYFINVWNHGGGWHFASTGTMQTMDISWDDKTGHFISTPQLGQALNEAAKIIGHKVDIYGSDACLMAMPEVALEMADAVSVYLGSEETEPGAGWAYDTFLSSWYANPNANGADIAKMLTDSYLKAYQNGSHGTSEVTFSAFDLTKINPLVASIKELGNQIRGLTSQGKNQLVNAISKTLNFSYSDYGDMIDFLDQIKAGGVQGISAVSMANVRSAVDNFVIANGSTKEYEHAHGVSFWLPSDKTTLTHYWSRYQALKFEAQTSWAEALKAVLK